MGTVIQPTIGRVVLCCPNEDRRLSHLVAVEGEPLAALVAYAYPVNEAGQHFVNLSLSDHIGQHCAVQGILLVQDGQEPPETGKAYCHWMPYQLGQAAKTEAVLSEANKTT